MLFVLILNFYNYCIWMVLGETTVLDQGMKIKSLKESEKEHLLTVLDKTHWDFEKTSRLLKISIQKIKLKIKEYGIRQADSKG